MAHRLLSLLLSLCLTATAVTAPPTPDIESESYILMDADTGAILAEKNPDLPLPPASLTKIMTAYAAFKSIKEKRINWDQQVIVSPRAWAQNVIGSKTFLEVNTSVSIADLLRGVIIQSGNDASIALAEAISGDEAAFAQWLNILAKDVGMTHSHFANSTGLPAPDHLSTARDTAMLIWQTIREFPQYYALYAEKDFTYNNITQNNRNRLLFTYTGADGVKTGYTEEAGYCLAASAQRDGRRFIAVVMKTPSPQARVRASAKLLSFGFNHFTLARPFNADKVRHLPVQQGTVTEVPARPTADALLTVERGKKVEAIFRPIPLIAPVAKGDQVGEIEIIVGGEVMRVVPVEAIDDVPQAGFFKRWWDLAKQQFKGDNHDANLLSEW